MIKIEIPISILDTVLFNVYDVNINNANEIYAVVATNVLPKNGLIEIPDYKFIGVPEIRELTAPFTVNGRCAILEEETPLATSIVEKPKRKRVLKKVFQLEGYSIKSWHPNTHYIQPDRIAQLEASNADVIDIWVEGEHWVDNGQIRPYIKDTLDYIRNGIEGKERELCLSLDINQDNRVVLAWLRDSGYHEHILKITIWGPGRTGETYDEIEENEAWAMSDQERRRICKELSDRWIEFRNQIKSYLPEMDVWAHFADWFWISQSMTKYLNSYAILDIIKVADGVKCSDGLGNWASNDNDLANTWWQKILPALCVYICISFGLDPNDAGLGHHKGGQFREQALGYVNELIRLMVQSLTVTREDKHGYLYLTSEMGWSGGVNDGGVKEYNQNEILNMIFDGVEAGLDGSYIEMETVEVDVKKHLESNVDVRGVLLEATDGLTKRVVMV